MRSGGPGGPENGDSFALLALVGGLDVALHLRTRALTPRKHALVDVHEGQNAVWPADGIPDGIFMGRYMAKWGSGEASGAPEFPLAIDQIGIGGVRTIELDGLRGLLRLVRRSGVAHLQTARKG